ncbi:MAG: hypothetical protein HRU50_03890 [Winogradskyella sp.]|uniref:hypothetical protein n=1 Tax=Winogradskyella sp. TaxID=1883156 RepID=UPI0025F6E03E|nr:hypothetical protein [Winogradskyella sp.]NRB59064.1 hypothetical protein [Winogradskyella sp.]
MNFIQSLETYTNAQKWVGTNFIILGSLLLILATTVAFFINKSPLADGLKWGALCTGLLIIIGGFSYRNFSDKIQYNAKEIYGDNPTKFIQTEYNRMSKVNKGFIVYQMSFAAFVVASLIVILFVKSPFAKGISFAVAVLFIGVLIIEGFSQKSITTYNDELNVEFLKIP